MEPLNRRGRQRPRGGCVRTGKIVQIDPTVQAKLQYLPQVKLIIGNEKIGVKPSFNILSELNMTQTSIIQQPIPINQYPHSCIGLITCEYQQNGKLQHMYGTGTLIHNSFVLTSAQNVYSRRRHKQCVNIKFIPGINKNRHSGKYDVIRVYYPKQYTQLKEGYEKYNFSILQLFDDLKQRYGYVGLCIKKLQNQDIQLQGYVNNIQKQQIKFNKEIIKYSQLTTVGSLFTDSHMMIKSQDQDGYNIVGIHNALDTNFYVTLEILDMINKLTLKNSLILNYNYRNGYDSSRLKRQQFKNLSSINFFDNNIRAEHLQYMSNITLDHLRSINLGFNRNLDGKSCQYIAQGKFICFNDINLGYCNIGSQGLKYLHTANWSHLTQINVANNKIDEIGCNTLMKMDWPYLMKIHLDSNQIGSEGIKYLARANWNYIKQIYLDSNKINNQGFKYFKQAKWKYLTYLSLYQNQNDIECFKYLKDTICKKISVQMDIKNLISVTLL